MKTDINEKEGVRVVVAPITDHASEQDQEALLFKSERAPELAWQPSFKARFPWIGFACLCGVILSSISAVLVLWRANNQSAVIWNKHLRPNVILTALNNLSNILITAAVGQGAAIAWWRSAMKGTTVKKLHYSWSFSTSFLAIFMKYKYFNLIALAALMTKFSVVDGILFQQSLYGESKLGAAHSRTFHGHSLSNFPETAAIYLNDTKRVKNTFGLFEDLLPWQYSSNEIYKPNGFQQCAGVCAAKLTTIGFTVDCNTTIEDVDIVAKLQADGMQGKSVTVFDINFETFSNTGPNNESYVQLQTTIYKPQNTTNENSTQFCSAKLEKRTCKFRPAMVKYPVVMQTINTTVTTSNKTAGLSSKVMLGKIDSTGVYQPVPRGWRDGMTQLDGFEVDKILQFQDINEDHSRLAGFTQVLSDEFTSTGYLHKGSDIWEMASQGTYASVEFGLNGGTVQEVIDARCPYGYGDPLGDIVFSLNTLTFITSDNFQDRGDSHKQFDSQVEVVGEEMENEVFYTWKWEYTIGAIVSTTFCIACILPAYWGFWELGRKVSLGPFEIANAFETPVFAHVHPENGHVDAVLKAAGREHVQYVARDDEESEDGKYYRFELQRR